MNLFWKIETKSHYITNNILILSQILTNTELFFKFNVLIVKLYLTLDRNQISHGFSVNKVSSITAPLPRIVEDINTDNSFLIDGRFVDVTLSERTSCVSDFQIKPSNRVPSSAKLSKLRGLMITKNISAYIIPNSDDHQVSNNVTKLLMLKH